MSSTNIFPLHGFPPILKYISVIPCLFQVFCTDVSQLVLDVIAHRGLNPHNCDVHCGFDGGQSMLKLALTVTDRLEGDSRGRAHYSDVR